MITVVGKLFTQAQADRLTALREQGKPLTPDQEKEIRVLEDAKAKQDTANEIAHPGIAKDAVELGPQVVEPVTPVVPPVTPEVKPVVKPQVRPEFKRSR